MEKCTLAQFLDDDPSQQEYTFAQFLNQNSSSKTEPEKIETSELSTIPELPEIPSITQTSSTHPFIQSTNQSSIHSSIQSLMEEAETGEELSELLITQPPADRQRKQRSDELYFTSDKNASIDLVAVYNVKHYLGKTLDIAS